MQHARSRLSLQGLARPVAGGDDKTQPPAVAAHGAEPEQRHLGVHQAMGAVCRERQVQHARRVDDRDPGAAGIEDQPQGNLALGGTAPPAFAG